MEAPMKAPDPLPSLRKGALLVHAAIVLGMALQVSCVSGCTQDPAAGTDDPVNAPLDVRVVISDLVPTVVTVSWTLDVEETGGAFIQYQTDGGPLDFATVVSDDGLYSRTLVGLAPSSEYTLRAVVDTDVGRFESGDVAFTTGDLPITLPGAGYDYEGTSEGQGNYLVTTVNSGDVAAVILDGEGEIVWWYTESEAYSPRALLSHDRSSVIVLLGSDILAAAASDLMRLVRVNLDGTVEESLEVPNMHHDFVELPDGTLAYIAWDSRMVEGIEVPVLGDRIVEMAPDGTEIGEVWSAWDHLEFDPEKWVNLIEPSPGKLEWTHANAIDYYPELDAYGLSLYHLGVVLLIDRTSGETVWQIGRSDSDFTLSSSVDFGEVGPQHQFDLEGDSLLVFNNGHQDDYETHVVEYQLAFDTATAHTERTFSTSPPLYCPLWGDASHLPDGNWLVTWSTAGLIEEVSPEGDVVSRYSLPLGQFFGYTTYVEDLTVSPSS